MTRPTDQLFDQRIADWLEDDPMQAPGQVLDTVLAAIPSIPRRRSARLSWRFQATPMLVRLAATAAIGVLAVGGAFLVIQRGQPGVGVAVPSPTPRSAPTPTPRSSPSPTPASPTSLPGPIGTGRQIHTATQLVDSRVLIAGGYALGDGPLASVVLYDPGTNRFAPTGSLAAARGYHTATLLADGRVLITGGGPPSWPGSLTLITGPFLTSAELYDPRTGTFSPTGSMATPREVHTANLLADGRVLITGGADYQARSVASAELYDAKTGTFSPTGSMTTARAFHTATLLADGRVLIAGGSPAAWGTTSKLDSAELYDPKTGTFTATGPMTGGRDFHTATVLADGRVLIAGGDTASQDGVPSAEIYDPTTAAFAPTGRMTDGREYHTATLLADGRVLVVGGGWDYTNRIFLASAELYDPTTGAFSPTGSLAEARTYQAASLLPDGRVLVTGGYGAAAPLASAEIYDPVSGTFSPAG